MFEHVMKLVVKSKIALRHVFSIPFFEPTKMLAKSGNRTPFSRCRLWTPSRPQSCQTKVDRKCSFIYKGQLEQHDKATWQGLTRTYVNSWRPNREMINSRLEILFPRLTPAGQDQCPAHLAGRNNSRCLSQTVQLEAQPFPVGSFFDDNTASGTARFRLRCSSSKKLVKWQK